MENNPIYQGTLYHPGNAPAPQVQQGTPELNSLMNRNERAMLASGIELDEELVNANDFALQQERVARTKDITDAFQAEMQDIASRAYGDAKSLFDQNGKFRESYYKERKAFYTSLLKGMANGFLGADAKAKATASLKTTAYAMEQFAKNVVKASLKQHGLTQFEKNFYEALAKGQYNLAFGYADQAHNAKIINPAARKSYRGKAKAHSALKQTQAPGGWKKYMDALPRED